MAAPRFKQVGSVAAVAAGFSSAAVAAVTRAVAADMPMALAVVADRIWRRRRLIRS
jgi:hypothetical protein